MATASHFMPVGFPAEWAKFIQNYNKDYNLNAYFLLFCQHCQQSHSPLPMLSKTFSFGRMVTSLSSQQPILIVLPLLQAVGSLISTPLLPHQLRPTRLRHPLRYLMQTMCNLCLKLPKSVFAFHQRKLLPFIFVVTYVQVLQSEVMTSRFTTLTQAPLISFVVTSSQVIKSFMATLSLS